MDLRNLFFLLTAIYFFHFPYALRRGIYCFISYVKVKKSLIKFDKGYEREKNKWIRLENVAFL